MSTHFFRVFKDGSNQYILPSYSAESIEKFNKRYTFYLGKIIDLSDIDLMDSGNFMKVEFDGEYFDVEHFVIDHPTLGDRRLMLVGGPLFDQLMATTMIIPEASMSHAIH